MKDKILKCKHTAERKIETEDNKQSKNVTQQEVKKHSETSKTEQGRKKCKLVIINMSHDDSYGDTLIPRLSKGQH